MNVFKRRSVLLISAVMVSIPSEESRDIIDRARWRTHFIGTRQSLGSDYGQGRKKAEKWRQRLLVEL